MIVEVDFMLKKQVQPQDNSKVEQYCNDLLGELINGDLAALSTDEDLIELANRYMAKAITYSIDGKIRDGLLVYIVLDLLEGQSLTLKDALNDKDLDLANNIDIYIENEVAGIYPEVIPATNEFEVRKYLKQFTDFESYYSSLLEDELEYSKLCLVE